MNWLTKTSLRLQKLIVLSSFITLSFIVGCGGSSDPFNSPTTTSGGPGGGTTDPVITISLQLVSQSTGSATQTITSANPGKIIATVSGATSAVIVSFSTDIASIPVPTAITDANNQASVNIIASSSLGAGTVTATVTGAESADIVYVVGSTNLQMGSGTPFVEGVANISVSQISAGGTTTVVVAVVDENGQVFNDPVEVNFSSSCSSAIPPTANLSTPINTVNGTASSTYLAQGCVGDDAISVTANAGGINLSATGSVNVLSADVGSIEFVSATPENIAIKGAGGIGGSESSTVIFRVRDTNGNPVNGQAVNFELNTRSGGIEINPDTATTDSDGLVQTVINSGTVSATIRVTATIDLSDPEVSTQSSNLVVITGIPDQDSFTISADILNIEAWNIANAQSTISVFLADGFNNPAPVGTTVSIQVEGGKIFGSCTADGSSDCSVIWNSQNPRPDGAEHSKTVFYRSTDGDLGPSSDNRVFLNNDGVTVNPSSLGQPYGGRVTITATTVGEESFPDTNGNGKFDADEMTAFLGNNTSGLPYDLDEAYTDYNEDGLFNPMVIDSSEQDGGDLEELIDFNSDGSFNQKDQLYNGVLCSIPEHAGCSTTQQSLHVRRSLTLIMSGSTPYIKVENPADGSLNLAPEEVRSGYIIMSDLHNQPLPSGTKVEFNTSTGSISFGGGDWGNDNHNGGQIFSFTIAAPKTAKSGVLSVKTTFPDGDSIETRIINIAMYVN